MELDASTLVKTLRGFLTLFTAYDIDFTMKRPSRQLLSRLFSGRFARFIVILFLVYAAVDITNPQLCNEDFAPSPVLLALNAERGAEKPSTDIALENSEETKQRQQTPSAPHSEDDFFCCCTHVIPGITTHPNGAFDVISQGLTLTPQSVTSAHLLALYHPPRAV